jgi:hypothetical protein
MMHIVPVQVITGPANLAQEISASERINGIWLLIDFANSDIYRTEYSGTIFQSWCTGGTQLIKLYYLIQT